MTTETTAAINWAKDGDDYVGMPAGMSEAEADAAGLLWHAERTPGRRIILRRAGEDGERKFPTLDAAKRHALSVLEGAATPAPVDAPADAPLGVPANDPEVQPVQAEAPAPEAPPASSHASLTWLAPPEPRTVGLSTVHDWQTACQSYYVRRWQQGAQVRFTAQVESLHKPGNPGASVDDRDFHTTLRGAIEACEAHLAALTSLPVVSNREAALADAGPLALCGGKPEAAPKEKVAKTPAAPKPKGTATGRASVLGYGACSVLRAMGKAGWDYKRARAAIDRAGASYLSDSSVKTSLSDGKSGLGSPPAPVTEEQLASLES